jgi:chromate reductase, NAD(P)H dehydrogenase (quinone)
LFLFIKYLEREESTMKALVFAGSTRTDSLHRKLARAAAGELRRRGLDVTLIDLRDYPMPLYDGDMEAATGLPPAALEFRKLLAENDLLVIASPEYNGSFPALVKNTIDWTSRPAAAGERPTALYRGKAAALLAASPGPSGGRRGLRHLRELLEMIGVSIVAEPVAIAGAFNAFDASGELIRPDAAEAVARLADQVAETAVGLAA